MEGADRLSELSDEMLVNNIMSRLDCTTKQLIRNTATISKRWRNLWTQLPDLIFIDDDDITCDEVKETDLGSYISFIDYTLNQRPTNLNLKKFKLDIHFIDLVNPNFESQANSWIRYAISRSVENVDLRLCVGGPFSYDDELLFSNMCFSSVKLSWCVLNPPNGAISWEMLKYLCLSCVTLDEDMIKMILCGSPCLEYLELNDCNGYRQVDITSKSVKKLVFSEYNAYHEIFTNKEVFIDCIKINAPYISSLTIQGVLVLRELVLLDVSSLDKVVLDYSIDFEEYELCDEDVVQNVFIGFITSLRDVEDVTLGYQCSALLAHLDAGTSAF